MRQIETHMQLVEQAIGRTFADNGLPVHLLGGVQGPHTLTFGLRLYQATATHLGKAQKLACAVEAALGDGPVRIVLERGVVWVETPSPVPTPVPGWQLEGQELAIPLGLTSHRTVAGVDLAQDPHLLLVGRRQDHPHRPSGRLAERPGAAGTGRRCRPPGQRHRLAHRQPALPERLLAAADCQGTAP